MSDYPFTPVVRALPAVVPFVGPEAQERARGRPYKARLGANENGFGPSLRVLEAMQAAAAESWMYGDPENHDLRQALAAHYSISAENIVVGEGIDGLYGVVAQMFADPGTNVVTSLGGYPTFNYQMAGRGAAIHAVPYAQDKEDLAGLSEKAHETRASLVFLANPDNPMGTWWPAADVKQMIEGLPAGCILCLDEAYSDLAPADAIPSIDVTNTKVLRFRTFSKAYGMAGARIGYAIGEASLIKSFEKVRNHFGVNRIAQSGALAALEDQAYLRNVIERIKDARERIVAIARENGLHALPSATNFVAIDCGKDGAFAAQVMAGLEERDIFVRKPMVAPLDRCIRVSVGTEEELDLFAEALPASLAAAH